MRKTMILTIALFILSALIMTGLYISIAAEKDNIKVTETVLFGDRKAAEGISVKLKAIDNLEENNWNLSYTLEPHNVLNTDTDYYKKLNDGLFESVDPTRRALVLSVYSMGSYYSELITKEQLASDFWTAKSTTESFDDYALWRLAPIEALFKDAAAKTKNGETHKETFDLRDYADFMPMELVRDYNGNEFSSIPLEENDGPKGRLDLSYFNIPIPDYDYGITATITKDHEGNIIDAMVDSTSNYYFDGSGLVGKHGAYIAVTRLKQYIEEPEPKEITAAVYPDEKRGIHYIPYRTKRNPEPYANTKILDMDCAELVFPLDKDVEVVELLQRKEDDDLQLFTEEKGKLLATIIDPKTMQEKQKLTVMTANSEENLFYKTYENCTLIFNNNGTFALLYEKDGKYHIIQNEFPRISEMKGEERSIDRFSLELSANVLPDGRGVVFIPAASAFQFYYDGRISHYLLVADEEGLQYAGFYKYDLDCDKFYKDDVGDEKNPRIVLDTAYEAVTITEAN